MAQAFITFEITDDRELGEGRTSSATAGAETTQDFVVTPEVLPNQAGIALVLRGLSHVELLSVRIDVASQVPTVHTILEACREVGREWLVLTLQAPIGLGLGVMLLDNANLLPMSDCTDLLGNGTAIPVPSIRIAGATLALLGTVSVTSVCVTFRDRNGLVRESNSRFGWFLDDSLGDSFAGLKNSAAAGSVPRLETIFSSKMSQGALLGVKNGIEVRLPGAGAAFPAPDPEIWLHPSDIGNAIDQVPADPSLNTAEHFLFHPSTFMRRLGYHRRVEAEGLAGGCDQFNALNADAGDIVEFGRNDPITSSGGALPLFIIDRPPTFSRWRLVVDSAAIDVMIRHPAGSDYRRPRDVWSKLFAPLLAANADRAGITLWDIEVTGGGSFIQRGILKRMEYLEYALFIEPGDLASVVDGTPIFHPFPQFPPIIIPQ
jgi:hypothetical protein